jgi:hypothetical protein
MKPATLKLLLNVVSTCLNAAVDQELITSNPARGTGRFIGTEKRVDLSKVFGAAQVGLLLQVARDELPRAYPFIVLLQTQECD